MPDRSCWKCTCFDRFPALAVIYDHFHHVTIIRILPHLRVHKGAEKRQGARIPSRRSARINVHAKWTQCRKRRQTVSTYMCYSLAPRPMSRGPDCMQCLIPYLSVEDILKDRGVHSDFKRHVNAKAIARDLRSEKIIPEAVETSIKTSQSSDEANDFLFEHLRSQATLHPSPLSLASCLLPLFTLSLPPPHRLLGCMWTCCFICGLQKQKLEDIPHGFDQHTVREHHMVHYM